VPVLAVEDDGIGWCSDFQARLAEKSGLGTLVVEQLCMQFGEKPVYGKADEGTGTRVTVRLSSLAEGEEAAAAPQAAQGS